MLPIVIGLWGIALITKAQVLPFWMVSLLVPLALAFVYKSWRHIVLLGVTFAGSLLLYKLLLWVWLGFLEQASPLSPLTGMYQVTALVWASRARLLALFLTFLFAMPSLLGLCYGLWSFLREKDNFVGEAGEETVRLALLVLAGSWFVWYLTLSVGWPRYLFPATFIGSIFVAAMLYDLTDRFSLSRTIIRGGSLIRHLRFDREGLGALLAIGLILIWFPRTLGMLYESYVIDADNSVLEVAHFLNTKTAPNALIETYDSELFFLLERPYHYPPDQIHVELNRRSYLDEYVPINYDPLTNSPDYIVVGSHSRLWRLYDPILKTGTFRLLSTYSRYVVYERVH
jgi:hypothetical protein